MPGSRRFSLERADRRLLRVVTDTMDGAAARAGHRLACRPGCDECCHGPFPINALPTSPLPPLLPGRAGSRHRILSAEPDPHGLEDRVVARLGQDEETLIAFVLAKGLHGREDGNS